VVGAEDAEVCDLVGVVCEPGSPRLFQSGLERVAVAAFNQAEANWQAQGQGKVALLARHLPTLQTNPVRTVAPGVDKAVLPPAACRAP
jgi:hypothetical protein